MGCWYSGQRLAFQDSVSVGYPRPWGYCEYPRGALKRCTNRRGGREARIQVHPTISEIDEKRDRPVLDQRPLTSRRESERTQSQDP